MERLTTYTEAGRAAIANNDNSAPVKQCMKIPAVIERLAQIEDILGDTYDLDDLREKMAREPVVHAHWKKNKDFSVECSACGHKMYCCSRYGMIESLSPYCPNCGAKMDEKEK